MNYNYAVEFQNVSKIFKLKKNNRTEKSKRFYALKDISFKVKQGDVVGILGTNGSGKSTLSNILSGISMQDEGQVIIRGEQALIAINIGLNSKLTGYENIKVKGALLGLTKKKIDEITDGVIQFAELGDFLYQPVKKYSSGMKARLGFSISIFLDPDILIIDEALSVGDSSFSTKCLAKIDEFKENGKTIFFVSHSLPQVRSFCNKALWIEGGTLKEYGDITTVADMYEEHITSYKKKKASEKKKLQESNFNNRVILEEDKESILKKLLRKF